MSRKNIYDDKIEKVISKIENELAAEPNFYKMKKSVNLRWLAIKNYENDELFIIGGKMVYENMLNRVDKLYLTRVAGSHEGNVYFPKINFDEFKLISQNKQGNLTFEVYERKK